MSLQYILSIDGLITGIVAFVFGVVVLAKNRRNVVNQTLFLLTTATAIWSFGYWQWLMVYDSKELALFWVRILSIGSTLIPIFSFHWIVSLLNLNKEKKKIIIISYILVFFFLLFSFSPLFVKDVESVNGFFTFWPKAGFLYTFYLIFIYAGLVVYSFLLLLKHYKTSVGLKKAQIKYVLLGFILGLGGGATNFFLWYDIPILPIGNFLVILYPILFSYSIIRHRLMDIRLVIKRSTIFSGIVIVITAVYVMAAFLLGWMFFGGVYTFKSQIITGLIVAVLTAIGFRPLFEWLKKTTDVFLFKGDYNSRELMADVSDVLSRTLDLDKVINTLERQITKALRLENMEVVVFEKEDLEKNSHRVSLITKSSFEMTSEARKALDKLANYFKKRKDVLVLEELKRKHSEGILSDKNFLYIEEMEKLKFALIIPLMLKKRLFGLFLLEVKKSGDMFTDEDIKTLETIAAQASIAIENARLYEEMKDFSKTLQKEVEFQTKELREANVRLQQLDKAKSEFISLASHQLRTPLSIIKGYISMMIEGSWGKVNEEQKNQLEKVYSSNERLIRLVEDLLAVSRIESGRLKFDFKIVSLEKMVIDVIEEFEKIAADKGLYLKYIEPKEKIPLLKIDALKIRQVVQNLVDNALHYTTEGGATIQLKKNKNKVIFSIKDTGIGVSAKEQIALFEKFSRGHSGVKVYTEGTGLGLYLAAKLVTAHQGRVWIKSKGKDKGSTFYFELPIRRKKK